ncbi:hypothetical protein GSI_12548 [Ganoderma sinense ZZ0214-1]|uniref:Uncharacterized protein n=1 Tax=Ganoderma sinense ZZ0214-1 TaxID=1077348 RepID=A0A2G8RT56_9APHY|nr:hypothetical protein GSI_12548 [Ganoderma sinense ZZ0214-1]
MSHSSDDQKDERCKALLPGKTTTRCTSWSARSNDFCPSHKEERWRLVRAYKDASERAETLKPQAVTTNEQLYALYSAEKLRAVEAATTEYLDAVRAELKGRTTVSERFYADGVQDGHHVRIKILVNEEAVVAALLVSLRARTRVPVPRQPLRPMVVNRAAPAQRDREYVDRQYQYTSMPMDYGPRVYGQPAGNGGPGLPLGGLLHLFIYATIAYGAYKMSKFLLLVARDLCQDIGAFALAPVTTLIRLVTAGQHLFGVREWVQTVGTNISGKVGDFARETLSLPTDPSELLKIKEDTLENAKGMLENAGKEIMERSACAWTSLSELAAKGVEAAGDTVASSVNDPGQAAKDVAEGLSEAREW